MHNCVQKGVSLPFCVLVHTLVLVLLETENIDQGGQGPIAVVRVCDAS